MIPAKIRKKPAILIDVPVGSATRMLPEMIHNALIVMSFAERTLMNVFSIVIEFVWFEKNDCV